MTTKKEKAEQIILREQNFLLETLLKTSQHEFQNDRTFFSHYEEGAKYEIKKLKLPEKQETHYIQKITDIYGPYSEDQPTNKPSEPYYTKFYQRKHQKPIKNL